MTTSQSVTAFGGDTTVDGGGVCDSSIRHHEPISTMMCLAGMVAPDSQDDHPPKKRRKRRKVTEADIGLFMRQYGRKAYRNHDPNDRSYDRGIEEKIKRMSAEDLDRLIRGDDQNDVDEQHTE